MIAERRKAAALALDAIDKAIESVGENYDVWEILFFRPGGKWKYTDYVVMTKPERWTDFSELVQEALNATPTEIRTTAISTIRGWTVVMANNPLGFPIMIVGDES